MKKEYKLQYFLERKSNSGPFLLVQQGNISELSRDWTWRTIDWKGKLTSLRMPKHKNNVLVFFSQDLLRFKKPVPKPFNDFVSKVDYQWMHNFQFSFYLKIHEMLTRGSSLKLVTWLLSKYYVVSPSFIALRSCKLIGRMKLRTVFYWKLSNNWRMFINWLGLDRVLKLFEKLFH